MIAKLLFWDGWEGSFTVDWTTENQSIEHLFNTRGSRDECHVQCTIYKLEILVEAEIGFSVCNN